MKIKNCALIEAFKCREDENIVEVARKLRAITLRHIFVVDSKDYPVGIISVIDINNRVVAEGKNPMDLTAKDIMSKPIDVVDLEESVEDVRENMIKKNRIMNAVVRDNKMIGIIAIHELLKCVEIVPLGKSHDEELGGKNE